ncbi:hypothetical protein [Kingella denitrificans]|uniref:hypothetical protein n=1 Tax=Kingella denitrificans TaxID=502 RepID=UPI00164B3778|nr:hypothetical protein [Kingella denitrificans]
MAALRWLYNAACHHPPHLCAAMCRLLSSAAKSSLHPEIRCVIVYNPAHSR